MGRQEFIDRLRAALNGNVSAATVAENVNYYNEYIYSEMRRGRSEEEILNSLGDPRLIARTIIETNTDGSGRGASYRSGGYSQEYGEYRQAEYNGGDGFEGYGGQDSYRGNGYSQNGGRGTYSDSDGGQRGRNYRITGWVWLIVLLVGFLVVIRFVFSVLKFLVPVLIPIIMVLFLVKLFRDWLN